MTLYISQNEQLLFSSVATAGSDLIRSVSLETSFDTVRQQWTGSSRVSPIWNLTDNTFLAPATNIHRTGHLFFAGPINPEKFVIHFGPRLQSELQGLRAFCSLGFLNLVVSIEDDEQAVTFMEFLHDFEVPAELWTVADGVVTSTTVKRPRLEHQASPVREYADRLSTPPFKDLELKAKQQELSLSALTASCRGAAYAGWVEQEATKILGSFDDDIAIAWEQDKKAKQALEIALESKTESDEREANRLAEVAADKWSHHYYGLTNATSGYSRFLAQALVGVSPIGDLECNFGPHSLLGVGLSSQALRNTVEYISRTLGRYRIVERFLELSNVPFTGDLPQKFNSDAILHADILGLVDEAALDKYDEIVPTVCYFSARDIFKHDLYTISVPVDTLHAANTQKWSLHTITHEMSHRFVEPILGFLFPTKPDELLAEDGSLLQRPAYQPSSWAQAAKQMYFQAMHVYSEYSEGRKVVDAYEANDETELFEIMRHNEDEVQEFIVHTFDYLYFYTLDAPKYIESIWRSWLALPGIENKIDDYIIRTVVALSVDNLHLTDHIEASRKQLERTFNSRILNDNIPIHRVIKEKISSGSYWVKELYPRAQAGNFSARFCRIFLYNDEAAARVAIPDKFETGKDASLGYQLEDKAMLNPLSFLSDYATDATADNAASAWIFYNLAFNLREKD